FRTYNAFGEVAAQYKEWGAGSLAPASLTRAIVAQYTYDKSGRVEQQLAGNGETDFFYDLAGDVTRQEQKGMRGLATDGKGPYNTRATETAYDLLGRATMQRLPVFGAIVSPQGWLLGFGETPFSRQAYDRWGNVVSHSQGGAVVNSDISAPNVVTE